MKKSKNFLNLKLSRYLGRHLKQGLLNTVVENHIKSLYDIPIYIYQTL